MSASLWRNFINFSGYASIYKKLTEANPNKITKEFSRETFKYKSGKKEYPSSLKLSQ